MYVIEIFDSYYGTMGIVDNKFFENREQAINYFNNTENLKNCEILHTPNHLCESKKDGMYDVNTNEKIEYPDYLLTKLHN